MDADLARPHGSPSGNICVESAHSDVVFLRQRPKCAHEIPEVVDVYVHVAAWQACESAL